MLAQDKTIDEIYDLVAMRVITSSVGECYRVLGAVHTLYTPVHDRIKDFIATPKINGYRVAPHDGHGSARPDGGDTDTHQEMHEQAEMGIAAHWTYKEGRPVDEELRKSLAWVRQLLEGNVDLTDAGRVPRVAQGRPLPRRDIRVHARTATSSISRRARRP